jgi:hypothetical protein
LGERNDTVHNTVVGHIPYYELEKQHRGASAGMLGLLVKTTVQYWRRNASAAILAASSEPSEACAQQQGHLSQLGHLAAGRSGLRGPVTSSLPYSRAATGDRAAPSALALAAAVPSAASGRSAAARLVGTHRLALCHADVAARLCLCR